MDDLKVTTPEAIIFYSRFNTMSDGSGIPIEVVKPTSGQKWWASALIGVLFAIIASPTFYSLTNDAFGYVGGPSTTCGEGATLFGLLFHALIFTLIIRFILW